MLDGATSETYYAQLVEEESTRTVMAALREVGERKGLFCALFSDRASHFFETPRAGGSIDPAADAGGKGPEGAGDSDDSGLFAAAGGRSERRFGAWQGRLPQELRPRGIRTADRFLREHYVAEINRKFSGPAAEVGHALAPPAGQDLDRIFSIQQERVVAKDNTVRLAERVWQLERTRWRRTLAGCRNQTPLTTPAPITETIVQSQSSSRIPGDRLREPRNSPVVLTIF